MYISIPLLKKLGICTSGTFHLTIKSCVNIYTSILTMITCCFVNIRISRKNVFKL